jgi:hypothetical protein
VPDQPTARLAELLAALSLVTDLARGRPPEEAMRACLLATRLARLEGLREPEAAAVYTTTLLRFVGCTATSLEYAEAFGGDDVTVRGRGDRVDPTVPAEALGLLWGLSHGAPALARVRLFAGALPRAKRVTGQGMRADCEVAATMARRFGLDEAVETALWSMFERWDGRGGPRGLRGEAIPPAARFAAVAFARHGAALLGELERVDDRHLAVVAAEPGLKRTVSERQLDEVARGFADLVDLKSPYLHGHSSGVAALAGTAAGLMGMAERETTALRRAGLFHDLGRAGVPTGLWDKPGPLSRSDWEQVRLHPYHTERILCRSPLLAAIGRLAGSHHERLDGSGYYRARLPSSSAWTPGFWPPPTSTRRWSPSARIVRPTRRPAPPARSGPRRDWTARRSRRSSRPPATGPPGGRASPPASPPARSRSCACSCAAAPSGRSQRSW